MKTSIHATVHVRRDTPMASRIYNPDTDRSGFAQVSIGELGSQVELLVMDPAKLDELADVCRAAASDLYAVQAETVIAKTAGDVA